MCNHIYTLSTKAYEGFLEAFPETILYPIVLFFPFYELKKGENDYGANGFAAERVFRQ